MDRFDEDSRRKEVAKINNEVKVFDAKLERKRLEEQYGQVWDTTDLQKDFEVIGFLAPYVSVIRKIDRAKGLLRFQHLPRFYFGFEKI
jgi:hypothetical protein